MTSTNPGCSDLKLQRQDLRIALEQFLAGEEVAVPETVASGCLISLPREVDEKAEVTYCNQISRILRKNCAECHRHGQIGPFVLDQYEDVIGWADMSLEVMEQGRMPPWHATGERKSSATPANFQMKTKHCFGNGSKLVPLRRSGAAGTSGEVPDS